MFEYLIETDIKDLKKQMKVVFEILQDVDKLSHRLTQHMDIIGEISRRQTNLEARIEQLEAASHGHENRYIAGLRIVNYGAGFSEGIE